jgi:hypothetical protein
MEGQDHVEIVASCETAATGRRIAAILFVCWG